MNPNNNPYFNTNYNNGTAYPTISNYQIPPSKPLLPYHQYINQSRNSNNANNRQSVQQNGNSNAYSGHNYIESKPSYSNLPTYEQFQRNNAAYQSQINYQPVNGNKQNNLGYNYQVGPAIEYSSVNYNYQAESTGEPNYYSYPGYHKNQASNSIEQNRGSKTMKLNESSNQKLKCENQRHSKTQKYAKHHREQSESKKVHQSDSQILEEFVNDISESQSDEDEEVIYQKFYKAKEEKERQKSKIIYKKKDPIMDTPEQIKKWVQMRKKNYPRRTPLIKQSNQQESVLNQQQKKEMSKLQFKIRKKIQIINGDSRNLLKKIRNIDILRRIVTNPKLLDKNKKQQRNERNIRYEQRKKTYEAKPEKIKQIPIDEDNQSVASIQPIEQPINKIPSESMLGEQVIQKSKKQSSLFEFTRQQKAQQAIVESRSSIDLKKDNDSFKHKDRNGEPQQIINHLKDKQREDKEWLNTLFDYKSNSHNYRYKVQTLQVNFKLEEIFQQTSHLLQIIRYIIKENFFDQTPVNKE